MQSPSSKSRWAQSFSALRHRNYRWFWARALEQSAAMGMQQLTVAWLILELTDSLSQFGIVLFLALVGFGTMMFLNLDITLLQAPCAP